MNLIHRVRAKVSVSVSVSCLVLVKIYGNNPKKLFVRIIRNNDVRMNDFPLFSFPFLRIVFISWCSLCINKLTIILFRDGINQILNHSPTDKASYPTRMESSWVFFPRSLCTKLQECTKCDYKFHDSIHAFLEYLVIKRIECWNT